MFKNILFLFQGNNYTKYTRKQIEDNVSKEAANLLYCQSNGKN
tara:strand:+ start:254 stop:382 length:129 start_codon:yes stop_codon:yes gene_type:complete